MSSIGEIAKFRTSIQTDTINEYTSASGVTADGVLLKDAEVTASGTNGVITNVIKAQAASGVKFQENGGAERGSYTDAGEWTLGPAAGAVEHTVRGAFSCYYDSGSSRLRIAANANNTNISSFGDDTSNNGSITFISYKSDASNEIVAGSISGAGAWTLGPTSNAEVNNLSLNGSMQTSAHGVFGHARGDYSHIGYNALGDSVANTYKYKSSEPGSFIKFTNGGFLFRTAVSGTAGNAWPNSGAGTEIGSATQAGAWTLGPTAGGVTHTGYGTIYQAYSSTISHGTRHSTVVSTNSNAKVASTGNYQTSATTSLAASQYITVTVNSSGYGTAAWFVSISKATGQGAIYAMDYKSATVVEISDPSGFCSDTSTPSGAGVFGIYKSADSYSFSIKKSDTVESISIYAYVIGAVAASVTDPA